MSGNPRDRQIAYYSEYDSKARAWLSRTPCPHLQPSTTTKEVLRVGGNGCRLCPFFVGEKDKVVTCNRKEG